MDTVLHLSELLPCYKVLQVACAAFSSEPAGHPPEEAIQEFGGQRPAGNLTQYCASLHPGDLQQV